METPCCKAAHKTDSTFLGRVEQPPKKRKLVCNETPDADNHITDSNSRDLPQIIIDVTHAQDIDPQNQPNNGFDEDPQKVSPNTEIPLGNDDHESSFNTYVDLNKESTEESSTPTSVTLNLASPPSKRPLVCNICGKHFLTKQALGGHQHAHKKLRGIQKARKQAQELRAKSFLYSLPRESSHPYCESYLGNHHQYDPYNGYAKIASMEMPVYSHPSVGPSQGPASIGRSPEEFVGPSSKKPVGTLYDSGWLTPFPTSLGSVRSYHRRTNFDEFNHVACSDLIASLQDKENEACLTKKQHMDSSGLNLSHNRSESPETGLPLKWDDCLNLEPSTNPTQSTELDLNLKL